ncbi:acyltransferase family protein [Desertifilum sp. FACHB-1129]|uniref:Glycerol acyltransferase n=1 Tax=Desertifilum tharense IPPAS B-1220 TaxID=1781255 RepID=A0A1E5QDW0_9CYAN|nr:MULTISPECIES: lysophospholipid acyltransferase family protein [Desertifilum]MDA0209059.1 lysophospholipid acyltransferase family protein [Cyanobacteria bacterium FC1]MBD2310541.1 acyltransferase family protein [Desertifilum sp. FACHB-1129]MBD2321993.1 acyltransferase family protein [Desertifilum sp. FACHB-866]MBD2332120.1 acyltransferase family protein [Desertifilum sp. FACHB-868]OEJ72848.1 glycerol acyltransferase [Desertifilum tharense IPPAS B-1220]
MSTLKSQLDGWSLDDRDPEFIKAWLPIGEWFYRYYFRVTTKGWHHIPQQGKVLLVGSHNGGMASPDTSMFMVDWFRRFGIHRPTYALMHPAAWTIPQLAHLGVKSGAIMAHPKMAIAALHRDAAVLVYPGGAEDMFRPHSQRHQIHLAGRKGFIKLALRERVPIVPLVSLGAHDTLIILGDLYDPLKQLQQWGVLNSLGVDIGVFPIYLGLPWGLGIGPIPNFPLPAPIQTRVGAPIIFERYGREAACDRVYVDACYQRVLNEMQQELDVLVMEAEQQ